MSSFTYEIPPSDKFLLALRRVFSKKGSKEAEELLNKAKSCEITTDSQFTSRRWNEFHAHISFQMDLDSMDLVNDEVKREILEQCDALMPSKRGLFVSSIDFSHSFDELEGEDAAQDFIEEISQLTQSQDASFLKELIDEDLILQGKELSGVYHLLFVVENTLRRFVEKILRRGLGDQFLEKANLNRDIKSSIERRKNEETKNAWLRVRGDSDIYYLDFIELAFVIKNNWEIFKSYFPSQSWIDVKIDELYKCRCLIAHNSAIGDHELDVIRTNYKSILLQLGKKQ